MQLSTSKHISFWGIMLSLCLILGFFENLIPPLVSIPGVKIGLSNLPVLLCLLCFGNIDALLLTIIKAVLSGFLFGSLSTILFSLSGAILSCLIMILLKQCKIFHTPLISASGAIMHNVGQIVVAWLAMDSINIFYYLPVLIISGLITGIIIGIIVVLVLPVVKKIIDRGVA